MKVPGIPYVQGRNDYEDRDGRKYGIAIHNTSNDASDEGEASYATRRTDGISSHFYVDGDSITQSIDTDDRVGHAGSYEGNEHAIAFELTGANAKTRQWWIDNIAWAKMANVIAYMLKNDPDLVDFQIRRASVEEMKANPKIKAFYGHDDMRRAWGGTTHTDPGPNFPWDYLIAEVKKAMEGEDNVSVADVQNALQTPIQFRPSGVRDRLVAKGWSAEMSPWELMSRLFEMGLGISQVDEAVLVALGNVEQDPAETARVLKAALGDKAEAVFRAGLEG